MSTGVFDVGGRECADWPESAGEYGPQPAEVWGGAQIKRLACPAEIPHTPVTSLAVFATTSHFLSHSPRRDASRRPQKHRSRRSGCRYTKSMPFPARKDRFQILTNVFDVAGCCPRYSRCDSLVCDREGWYVMPAAPKPFSKRSDDLRFVSRCFSVVGTATLPKCTDPRHA